MHFEVVFDVALKSQRQLTNVTSALGTSFFKNTYRAEEKIHKIWGRGR